MKPLTEANIGALDNAAANKFIEDVAHKFKKHIKQTALKDSKFYTKPVAVMKQENKKLYGDLTQVSFDYPDGIELSTGKTSEPFRVYINIEWFNRKPKPGPIYSFSRQYYSVKDIGVITAGNVMPYGDGYFMNLKMNEIATPGEILKYFDLGEAHQWKSERIDSVRSILDHETLHIFDSLMGNIQDKWGKQPYFTPRSHDDEEMRRYVEQPLEFRAWVVTMIRELETAYKKEKDLSLEDYLAQSTAWYRFTRTRKANPKLSKKLGKIAVEWYSRKQQEKEKSFSNPKQNFSSFADINKQDFLRNKFPQIQKLAESINFEFHETLNPKLWDGDILKKEVRTKLLKIANAFHKFINLDAKLKDVIITGSSSNYNYSSKHSDIDLHLLYDFSEILSEDGKIDNVADLVKEYMLSKKSIWNDKFNITINGIEVELYAQDIDEPHEANGQFSITDNKWIKTPSKEVPEWDTYSVDKKAEEFMGLIDSAINSKDLDKIEKLKDKIKKLRKSGLDSNDGEFSTENLAFKTLRRNGYIEKLNDVETAEKEKELSL